MASQPNKLYIYTQNIDIFAWIVPVKWNYKSIEDRRWVVQGSIPPKNDSRRNIRSSPKIYFVKELLGKYFINLIYLSKLLVILYHKQTYKRVIFSEAAHLFLAASLKKRTFSYAFFLKSRYFTRQVLDAISSIGGVYYETMWKTYFN